MPEKPLIKMTAKELSHVWEVLCSDALDLRLTGPASVAFERLMRTKNNPLLSLRQRQLEIIHTIENLDAAVSEHKVSPPEEDPEK